jgi:hypothetical protein
LIEKVRSIEEQLTELKIRRAEAGTEAEKQKLSEEILALEKQLTETELQIAAKVEEANKAERKEVEARLNTARNEAKKAAVDPANEDMLSALKMEEKAAQKFEDAKKLRAEAAKEKDLPKKNLLLMKANVAEQLGNRSECRYTQYRCARSYLL